MTDRWTITVPLTLNDGTETPAWELHLAEVAILDIAGGFTATDGEGTWLDDDGQLYREPVRLFTFDVSHIADVEVLQLAQRLATRLDQEAVYVTRQEITERHFVAKPELVTA